MNSLDKKTLLKLKALRRNRLRDAIKTILDYDLSVDDGYVSLYWANGPMGRQEGDPTPYVVCTSEEDDEVYKEYESVDDAINSFFAHARLFEN